MSCILFCGDGCEETENVSLVLALMFVFFFLTFFLSWLVGWLLGYLIEIDFSVV